MNIAIVGSGYVGLVTGVCLAHIGHHVICVDNDLEKVKLLIWKALVRIKKQKLNLKLAESRNYYCDLQNWILSGKNLFQV